MRIIGTNDLEKMELNVNGASALMKCYLCGRDNLGVIRTKLRYDVFRDVLRCQDCGITYLKPKDVDMKNYYNQNYRKLYTPIIGKTLSAREIFNFYLPYQQERIDEIKHILNPKMKVLDIGCSTGHFLYAMRDYVQECIGIEFNREDARFTNEELGIKTYTEPIQDTDIPLEYFDLVTVSQVLEHIDDPIGFLTTIYNYMKPDGFLYIEVPNIRDALIFVYNIESYADFWFREPHVFYFSPETLSMVLERSGFSGATKTVQGYNFINHINWILTGNPQESVDNGMSKPMLINSESVNPIIRTEFNNWIQEVDKEYKQLLNKHNLGENIIFIGKKANRGHDLGSLHKSGAY